MNIAILSPSKDAYSETFIHAHVKFLPATKVHYLYGGFIPKFHGEDEAFLSHSIVARLGRKLSGTDPEASRKKAIAQYLEKNEVKAVLAEYGPTAALMLETCHALNIPVTVHFHGYDAYMYKTLNQFRHDYEVMFKKADAFIAVSRDMERQLLSLGAAPEKLHYNPYGFNPIFEYHDAGSNPPVFLSAGRFVDKKSPHLTILAFRELLKEVPDAKLVMLGNGPLQDSCKVMVEAMGLTAKVEMKGAVSHEEIGKQMAQARAFVQHSLRPPSGDSEGTPVAIIEACASGLPVISTRHAGIPDVVLDGETGLLCEEKDYLKMAKNMITIAREPELATQMGRKSHERIASEFTMDRYINKLWEIIESTSR